MKPSELISMGNSLIAQGERLKRQGEKELKGKPLKQSEFDRKFEKIWQKRLTPVNRKKLNI